MGLSRALCLTALAALKAAGATLATVKPRGDLDYPVPRQAYRSMGFVSREGRPAGSRAQTLSAVFSLGTSRTPLPNQASRHQRRVN